MLDKAAKARPNEEALVDGRSRLTYAELAERIDRLSAGLAQLGIRQGDCVLLQLPNWNEFVLSFFALQKIGAPAILLLPRHRQVEINYFCGLTKAKVWMLPEHYRNADYLPIIGDVMKANPTLKRVITVRSKESRFTSFERLIGDEREHGAGAYGPTPLTNIDPNDVAFVIPTGGTTGLPKAVPRTHNDAVCEARYKATAREQTDEDICMISVPLEHNLGLAALNSTFASGGKVVLVDSTRAEDLCAAIQRERVARAPLVPTLLSRLVEFEGLAKYDLSSLKALYVGGARTPPDLIKTVHRKLGRVYVSAFGMSEGPTCTTRLSDGDDIVLSSIGKPCCQFDRFKVVDAAGKELPRITEGELMAKGPGVFSGYLNYPEENRRSFSRDGFFRTGDLASIDDAGNIRITGRIKDIIIRGGENISPVDIESLIRAHPDVEDVAVVGMPDKELGERACAYVKPKRGKSPSLEEIVSFLQARGASVLQLPERVELTSRMPLTKVGKADKKALQERIKRKLGL